MGRQRQCAVMVHQSRVEAHQMAAQFIASVTAHGIACLVPDDQRLLVATHLDGVEVGDLPSDACGDTELVVVFGGDGTILRAAEWALAFEVPLLGVNMGHVGFLAELESSQVNTLVDRVVGRTYQVERRLTLQVSVTDSGGVEVWQSFAVNETSLEKASRQRMLDVLATFDGRPVSRWGCDGVLVSTPTGSTAYAFSAGGPVMWPDLEAIVVVPLSAHALFARPLVLSPNACVDLDVLVTQPTSGVVWCDGRRSVDVAPGSRVRLSRGPRDLLLARLGDQPFADRLVRKFALPVEGWRRRDEPAPVG